MTETNAKRKVLIITYYWPPSGGSGVQRWLKFVKYLHRSGWEPIVFTPENPSFTLQDPSLANDVPASVEVLRLPIWEPYELFQRLAKLTGKKQLAPTDLISSGRKTLFQKFSSWVRGNLFIPDARVFWVKPASTFLRDFIRHNQIDKIITTGPPHSIHLIGLKLKKENPALQWVADFRDPWSEWDLLDTLSLTSFARKRHRVLEQRVLRAANRVVTIAPFHVKRFQQLGKRAVDLITNGFDEEDFAKVVKIRTLQFTIRHIGLVDELRDPRPVMQAIAKIGASDPSILARIRIEFIGSVNSVFREWVDEHPVLREVTHFVSYMPHDALVKLFGSTDLQLLVLAHTAIAPGNLPGKFFEYLASGNPILTIGPGEGDAGEILRETGVGEIFERSDLVGIEKYLLKKIDDWAKGTGSVVGNARSYTREHLTRQLIQVLESR